MNRSQRLILTVLVALCAVPATATIIYDNGAPDLDGAFLSDFDGNISVSYAEHAETFVLQPGFETITDIHWWGVYAQSNTPSTDDFTIRIFEDDAGSPELAPIYQLTSLAVGRADTGLDMPTQTTADLYAYWVDIAPITLSANTTFWISIINDTSNDADDDWYWATSDRDFGSSTFRTTDGASWTATSYDLAFYLTGPVVPEPASMALLGLGLAGLALRRRK